MLVGLVSDTHDDLAAIEAAVTLFESHDVDAVVHCGDFVAPFSVTPFDADFDFYATRGNNDGEWAVESTVDAFGSYLGEAGTLSFPVGDTDQSAVDETDSVAVAVTHGTSEVVVDALVECGDYDVVVHGHTHARAIETRGDTIRVNPGGLPIPVEGADDAFHVAVLDTGVAGAESVTSHRLTY